MGTWFSVPFPSSLPTLFFCWGLNAPAKIVNIKMGDFWDIDKLIGQSFADRILKSKSCADAQSCCWRMSLTKSSWDELGYSIFLSPSLKCRNAKFLFHICQCHIYKYKYTVLASTDHISFTHFHQEDINSCSRWQLNIEEPTHQCPRLSYIDNQHSTSLTNVLQDGV